MPPVAPRALVLVDVGSTRKLTLPYVVDHVMPIVQQHRLTRLSHSLRPRPTHADESPSLAFHQTTLFAYAHVCAFAPREPSLQHESWHQPWSRCMSARSGSCSDSGECAPSEAATTTLPSSSRAALFGTPKDNVARLVTAALCGGTAGDLPSPLHSSSSPGPLVVSSTPDGGPTHLTELHVPDAMTMECFRVDTFVPTVIQMQECARHVLLHPAESPHTSELATLAIVCADHDVERCVSFMRDLAPQSDKQMAPSSQTSMVCSVLLFDATHGLRHACRVAT